MSNPTSNFNWQMPTNTDLVTDLPADFEVFGQAVDTTLADLKGGTSGQILAKNSNTDMDFVWIAQDDANAIQNSIVDAKGDLIGATANDTPARLAVGTNGQVLTADSTAATGLAWSTISTGFTGVNVYNSVALTIPNTTYTTLTFDSEYYDTSSFHSTSVNNSRLTVPSGKAGYYRIDVSGLWQSNTTGDRLYRFMKNGSSISTVSVIRASYATDAMFAYSWLANLAVGDYIEVAVYQSSGGNLTFYNRTAESLFSLSYLGA